MVSYGILSEERRLRVFENMILRRIFVPNRDENGEWRRLYNEGLPSMYRLPNIVRVIKSRRLRWVGHVARMEEGRSAFKIFNRYTFRKNQFTFIFHRRPSYYIKLGRRWKIKVN